MEDIWAVQAKLQADAISNVENLEEKYISDLAAKKSGASGESKRTSDDIVNILTDFVEENAYAVLNAWQKLFPAIITKYHDGYRAQNLTDANINMYKLFYPEFWLDNVGFFDTHRNTDPNALLFSSLPSSGTMATVMAVLFTSCLAFGAGMMFQKKLVSPRRTEYLPIDEL
jgi:hypothetical protein